MLGRQGELLRQIAQHLEVVAGQTTKSRLRSPHLSIDEAAAYLGIKPDTLKRKMQRRVLPFHRRPGGSPYFMKSKLDRWLADPVTLVVGLPDAGGMEALNGRQTQGPLDAETIRRLIQERAEFPDRGEGQD